MLGSFIDHLKNLLTLRLRSGERKSRKEDGTEGRAASFAWPPRKTGSRPVVHGEKGAIAIPGNYGMRQFTAAFSGAQGTAPSLKAGLKSRSPKW